MNIQEFETYGLHFINLGYDQERFEEVFDYETIENVAVTEETKTALRLLSQILVGNISETMEEINEMKKSTKKETLKLWLRVLKDPYELKSIGMLIIDEYV